MEFTRPSTRARGLGAATGTFLVLVAIATLIGQPWVYVESTVAAAAQVVAAVLTLGIGVGLLLLGIVE